jgi:hypothetical protein
MDAKQFHLRMDRARGERTTAVGGPPGDYIFQTTFNLTANGVSSAELMGRLASDNSVQILLNGVNTGMGASDFEQFTSFQITSGFVQGVNRLDFLVTNDDCGPLCVNPTGLRVEYRLTEFRNRRRLRIF